MIVVNPFTGEKQFLAGYRKPGFKYQSTKSIVVEASENAPAYFILGGMAIQKKSNLECNLLINGPGGLDTGTLSDSTIYYLYAVLSNDDVTLMASLTDPDTGVTGYTWTYLGGFLVNSSSNVAPFYSNNGTVFTHGGSTVTVNNASPAAAKTLTIPTTAVAVYYRMEWGSVNATGDDCNISIDGTSATMISNGTSTTAAANPVTWGWCAIIEPRTLYFYVTNATTDSCVILPFGWIENVEAYQ